MNKESVKVKASKGIGKEHRKNNTTKETLIWGCNLCALPQESVAAVGPGFVLGLRCH